MCKQIPCILTLILTSRVKNVWIMNVCQPPIPRLSMCSWTPPLYPPAETHSFFISLAKHTLLFRHVAALKAKICLACFNNWQRVQFTDGECTLLTRASQWSTVCGCQPRNWFTGSASVQPKGHFSLLGDTDVMIIVLFLRVQSTTKHCYLSFILKVAVVLTNVSLGMQRPVALFIAELIISYEIWCCGILFFWKPFSQVVHLQFGGGSSTYICCWISFGNVSIMDHW